MFFSFQLSVCYKEMKNQFETQPKQLQVPCTLQTSTLPQGTSPCMGQSRRSHSYCHSLQACPRPYLHFSARDLLGTSQRTTERLRANVLLRGWPEDCSKSRWITVGTPVPRGIFQRCANRELSPSAGTSRRWQEARRRASSADSCQSGTLPHR